VSGATFSKQFAALYFVRLLSLRPHLMATASRYISSLPETAGERPLLCARLLDSRPGLLCCLTGTLYKQQRLKPSILSEYSAQKQGHSSPTAEATSTRLQREAEDGDAASASDSLSGRWTSEDDSFILEDESGRMSLLPAASSDSESAFPPAASSASSAAVTLLDRRSLCTGVVVSVLGRQSASGRFAVERVFLAEMPEEQRALPGLPLQAARSLLPAPPPSPSLSLPSSRFVLLVSGLSFGCPWADPLPLQLLVDWVCGFAGQEAELQAASRVQAVVVCGDSLHRFSKRRSKDGLREEVDVADYARPCREMDAAFTRLAASVPALHLLPGAADPANMTLPQQPMHPSLTPAAAGYASFHCETNPAYIHLPLQPSSPSPAGAASELRLLCSSGQNLTDALSNLSGQSGVDVLRSMLRWRHICPTAPDTLPCYPHQTLDPFILRDTPHLLVAGNQPSFETAMASGQQGQRCRLLCLPSFARSGCAVLVDIASPELRTQPLQFSVQRRKRS
jgi:DNA polymerase delta subunit 2